MMPHCIPTEAIFHPIFQNAFTNTTPSYSQSHPACKQYIPTECSFGALEPIFLPPHAVSVPRTEVPIEAIIGIKQPERKESSSTRKYPYLHDASTAKSDSSCTLGKTVN